MQRGKRGTSAVEGVAAVGGRRKAKALWIAGALLFGPTPLGQTRGEVECGQVWSEAARVEAELGPLASLFAVSGGRFWAE